MKTQLKKGFLDVCILAALLEEDSYGYKLIQDTKEIVEMSESTLYPILRRLESSKYLTSYKKEYNGRLRKYYKITNSGIGYVKDFLTEWEDVDKLYRFIKEKFNE